MWNKTETKLFCFSFISVLFHICERPYLPTYWTSALTRTNLHDVFTRCALGAGVDDVWPPHLSTIYRLRREQRRSRDLWMSRMSWWTLSTGRFAAFIMRPSYTSHYTSSRRSVCPSVCSVCMGGATIGAGRDMSPHFCGMYPAGGTTQFTLYTCGVHRVLQPAAEVTQLFTFGFSTWKFCFLFLYSLLLVIQSRKLGPWILHCWRTR